MTTRVTGMNSGLDVDSLVTAAMKPYKTKVDKEVQNRKVLEYQQTQYKQIMSDASDFYDKYFDVLKTGNMMSESSYQTETFTSPDGSKVTAKGLAGASLDNYTVNVTQLAAKASDQLSNSEVGDTTIKIGSAEIKFKATSDGTITVSNYNAAVAAKKIDLNKTIDGTGTPEEKKAAQLALTDLNNNTVTAKYSEFTKNVAFTASAFGGDGFTLSVKKSDNTTSTHSKAEDKYLEATIKNGKGEVYTISSTDKQTSNTQAIDNVQFTFNGISKSTSAAATNSLTAVPQLNESDIMAPKTELKLLDEITALPKNETTKETTAADGTVTAVTSSSGTTTTTVTAKNGDVTITSTNGTKTSVTDKYGIITTTQKDGKETITTTKIGTTNQTITTTKTNEDGTIPITKVIELESGIIKAKTTTLKSSDGTITTTAKSVYDGTLETKTATTKRDNTDGSTITITITGPDGTTTTEIKVNATDGSTTKTVTTSSGTNLDHLSVAEGETKTENGKTTTKSLGETPATTITTQVGTDGSLTKTVTTDGIPTTTITTVTKATTYNSPTSLAGTTDVKDLKDKIVKFVDDYNKIITELNTKIFETRDKDYMPLTDEQKKGMSEDQITTWEKKAQTGLLRKDSDLQRIASEMKSAMSSVMSGSGLSLDKIGISPIKNYTDKNGILSVNESKLTTALEENGADVKDLFTRAASTTDQGGALTRLKSSLYSEFKTSTSSLSKKAGWVGSSTEYDNVITKSINDKKTLIKKLNTSLSVKEEALYKKYSALETAMETLNSQKASLTSTLGQS